MGDEDRIAALERELADARAAERRMRGIFDHAYQFTGLLSLDGHVLEANQSALALIGVTREAVIGQHFADTPWWAHSAPQQAQLRDAIARAAAGELVRFEATHPDADGVIHTVDFSVKPLLDGDRITHLVCEGRDLTDRKQAEAAVAQSQAMLALVLDAIPVRVFWKDREGRYLGCNASFARDAGVETIANVLGKTDVAFTWHPQAARYRRDDQTVMATGLPILHYEEPQTSPQGKDLWLQTSKLPLRDARGEIVGVLGTYQDITERKLEEQQRLAVEVQMQHVQKLESLGLLAGTIAHDFNNLLTTIIGNVELVRMRVKSEREQPLLADIATAAHRAADLCRQLFVYAGRGDRIVGPVDLNAIVLEMSGLLRVSVQKKGTLELALDPALSAVLADGTQLRQILMNLITNAADALGERGGSIWVRTSQGGRAAGPHPGAHVVLEVEDDGCGMDAATRARIFEPFFSTKAIGRGLGLAAIRGIVDDHRGALEVDSEPGRGTRFRVLLPASDARVATGAPEAAAPMPSTDRRLGRILLVDDEPALLMAGARLVAHLGFEVDTATDGRDALERYEVGKFALVIVDMTMPRFDGIETTRALRARDPEVKVVLTSGFDVRDQLAALGRGRPDDFLAKPFSAVGLSELLHRYAGASD
ncbi:MAG: PAS domain-containing protein [Deltaproteobacteria bacterium]|nr:PAS domain-containing protein [Deltaproteobacteria bacterium]